MLDFLEISTRTGKKGTIEIYPSFIVSKSKDLMIRGRDFYAVWVEDKGLWSTDEDDLTYLVDSELRKFRDEYVKTHADISVRVCYLRNSSTRMISQWHQFCQRDMRDNFKNLDEHIVFQNDNVKKEDYVSRRLDYPLQEGSIEAYDRLMSVLYSQEERTKIEWAVGSIITGDSKKIQKFLVLYGSAGTGKSTVLNIIQKLFEGYYATFDSKALGSSSDSFALEAFKDNPLVAIQHDGDLSRIEDNTRLNSLVSHETMRVNEKFRPTYSNKFISFLFMGTNKPVRITDAKSGLIRRLIDVTPTGNKVSVKEYRELMKKIDFELGAIAYHCKQVYLSDPGRYDNYIPVNMMGASNDFYNFVLDYYFDFEKEDGVSLSLAWERYQQYCIDAKVLYPMSRRVFQEELKNYFSSFEERKVAEDGSRIRSYYSGFKKNIFKQKVMQTKDEQNKLPEWIELKKQHSLLDDLFKDCPAQYASEDEKPINKWSNVTTKLSDLDTTRLHYVKVPDIHYIFMDFDLRNEAGEKSRERNLEEASKWPATYAEFSKGGAGVHLHYIYDGDPEKLDPNYAPGIEVKVMKGGSSLRRRLSECNDIPMAHISSGLPLKKEVNKKTIDEKRIKTEKSLRNQIVRNLRKEVLGYTKPSMEFIKKILDDAYADGLVYDVTDMVPAMIEFAANSTHNAEYCIKLIDKMKLKSDDFMPEPVIDIPESKEKPLVFFDIEVAPNVRLWCWKYYGKDQKCVRMFNPSAEDVNTLFDKCRVVGFNCRRYDNHISYGLILGDTIEQTYRRSMGIISNDSSCFLGGAWNLSYTDVYDFCSKKQSLKKWEIELDQKISQAKDFVEKGHTMEEAADKVDLSVAFLEKYWDGIQHKEFDIPWDQPVPEDQWEKLADYCCNDVIATEAVWDARQPDFIAREILADVAGLTVNDTTNGLTTGIIFQGNKKPQNEFNYRNMGDMFAIDPMKTEEILKAFPWDVDEKFTVFDSNGRPIFPGYLHEKGKSTYRGEEVGEGGYVYAEEGIWGNVALLDVASMHPTSMEEEMIFGPRYTKRFSELKQARIAIKHKEFDKAKTMLGGVLAKYLDDPDKAKSLAQALKIAINSVYGLTAAKFENPFRDLRNKDNIVAKRGALFMVNLKHEVQRRGFTVAHIKTDSIKIPDATPEIIQFVMDYGKLYGYTFEHEDTYERMCLVNDAVYIAKSQDGHWSATGKQFQVPYVFKRLFTHEDIIFADLCETKAVSGNSALYLDMNEGLPDVTEYEKEAEKLVKAGITEMNEMYYEGLCDKINAGHDYIFVGKVGLFTPVRPDCGGGELFREKDGKYYAVSGTKGYRWLESDTVKLLKKDHYIDLEYYERLVDEARETIRKYGEEQDAKHGVKDWFFSDIPY